MKQPQYEVEIKTLLGSLENAEALKAGLKSIDPNTTCTATSTQLNHYFEGGDPKKVVERLAPHLSKEVVEKMEQIAGGQKISVRTRGTGGVAKIVVKASIGSDSSENGVMRMEVEEVVPGMTLDALDAEVLTAGYQYQAKWSRSREEYSCGDLAVSIDKNAGYGYLAEFEKVVGEEADTEPARAQILKIMAELGVAELPQDRLERMFAFYNTHWPEYYGTDKIFTIN